MATVGVRELKNQLTRYLRRVGGGEEVVVTQHGKPIALIRPIRADEPAADPEVRLAQLAARGIVTLPTSRPSPRLRAVKARGAPLSRTIIEDRR